MDTLITIGYWIGGFSIILSVIGYIVFPKMIKAAFSDQGQKDSDTPQADS